jgi:oligopeptide transport system ATP-binding protein
MNLKASAPLLEVKNLKKHFPITGGFFGKQVAQVYAVDGVSFTLEAGKTLGLVGESGCGKSTLGRSILRLIEPTSGSIHYQGEDITHVSQQRMRDLRRELQIVFQDPFSSLNPRLTVRKILEEPFDIHGLFKRESERTEQIERLMKEVGLRPELADRYPHEFSGGQRQRIGIARALSLKPKLIVADEPVSALDVSIQSQILNLMMDLRDAYQLSYIFVAHDLAVIEHISDEVAVMYLGRIVEHAPAKELYANPTHPYTRALIASIPKPKPGEKRKKSLLEGDVPSPITPPKGCHFHTRCPSAKDICRTQAPALNPLSTSPTHRSACHFNGTI